ncbi:MAG: DUF2834 domain-containing protein [Gammaproteobacteria bacterium]|nr:DUF2834 domain-containing protein [Gammaproteobacteria bacterium]
MNSAAGGFIADPLIRSVVFWMSMFSNKADWLKPWAFRVLNLFTGLSCAFPVYLWVGTLAIS